MGLCKGALDALWNGSAWGRALGIGLEERR